MSELVKRLRREAERMEVNNSGLREGSGLFAAGIALRREAADALAESERTVESLRALLREAHQALLNCTHPNADTVPSSECSVCELQQRIGRATDPDLYAAPLTVAPPREPDARIRRALADFLSMYETEHLRGHDDEDVVPEVTEARAALAAAPQGEATPPQPHCLAHHEGYYCTQPKGHAGQHEAYGSAPKPYATWPAQEAHAGAGE